MSEIPKVSSAELYLNAQRFQSTAQLPHDEESTAQQTGGVEEILPFVDRRKNPDRRRNPNNNGQTPFDTRQRGERRKSIALDYEV